MKLHSITTILHIFISPASRHPRCRRWSFAIGEWAKPVWILITAVCLLLEHFVIPAETANSMYGGARKKVGHRPLRCYSCMSTIYASIWEITSIDSTFFKQLDFTDKCQRPEDHRDVRFMDCEKPCVKMSESIDIAGSTVKVYIRGCYNSILRYGFNRSLASVFYNQQHCQNFTLQQLKYSAVVGNNPQANEARRKYNVCTCKTDLCNGANRLATNKLNFTGSAGNKLLLCLALSLIILANQWILFDHVTT